METKLKEEKKNIVVWHEPVFLEYELDQHNWFADGAQELQAWEWKENHCELLLTTCFFSPSVLLLIIESQ